MKEQERKFILRHLPEIPEKPHHIKQAYLLMDGKSHLRVRIIDNQKGFLTYKSAISNTIKNEFEYEIPLNDAIELFNLSPYRLEKQRYKTTFQGNTVDIDIYPNGLKIVEIEFENELTDLPDYCGEDVSDDQRFSNIEIAKKNGFFQ